MKSSTFTSKLAWVEAHSDGQLEMRLNLRLYPLAALFRVCYRFTDKCYLFITEDEKDEVLTIHFTKKEAETDLSILAGEFSNELIYQKVRFDVAAETQGLRDLIAAQAFAEADILDRSKTNAGYYDDPRRIST
jgi:His-Xaa-Ser system protein HxsD